MSRKERATAALWAAFCGDALAMPVHWYYNTNDIRKDFGKITDFQAPKSQHPSSIMSLHSTGGQGRGSQTGNIVGGVILHDKKKYWGQHGVHYHRGMQPGENTLNALCARIVLRSAVAVKGYDKQAYLRDYVHFMTTPGTHNDTYAESYHREFFKNYSQGVMPEQCAGREGHDTASMGGLVTLPPVILLYHSDPKEAEQKALAHMHLTHKSAKLDQYARAYIHLFCSVMNSAEFPIPHKDFTELVLVTSDKFMPDVKLRDLLDRYAGPEDDAKVVGRVFSTACYIEDSLPSLFFLAAKYAPSLQDALIANTNLGGENCHRGFVLAALLGAARGLDTLPQQWIQGLHARDALEAEISSFVSLMSP